MPVQELGKDNYLNLTVEYSELLLEGSTLTVAIDDQPIKSVTLDPDKGKLNLKMILPDFALTKGFHNVQISFYGQIAENLCANEENPANWLTVSSSSFLLLNTQDLMKDDNPLENYPYPFVQNNTDEPIPSVIVIPNEPSLDILSSAFKLAHYLNNVSTGDEPIQILTEAELDKVSSHLIVMGTTDQFSKNMLPLIEQAKVTISDNEFQLSSRYLKIGDIFKQVLFVMGTDIEKYISLLTEEQLIDQLAGNDLAVNTPPVLKQNKVDTKLSLKDIKLSHITLTGISNMTKNYFYPIPSYIDSGKDAALHLKLNISETLLDSENLANAHHENAELLIIINDIPHSVALQNLEDESFDGFYNVQIPVNKDVLQKHPYLAIQFRGLGLKNREICVPPSDDKWIFIHEDSFIQFNQLDQTGIDNFKSWPAPFVSPDGKETTIIVPNRLSSETINHMKEMVSSLGTQSTSDDIHFVYENDLSEEVLKNNHLIFLGYLKTLEAHEDLLIRRGNNGDLNVAEFGFLNETSRSVAWIQPSVWNDNNSLAVFAAVNQPDKNDFSSEKIINYIKSNRDSMSIIVEGESGEVFTDKYLLSETDNDKLKEEEKPVKVDLKLIISIITLFIIGLILFIVVYRAGKKAKQRE